jgi:hypothetical protein
MKYHNQNDIEYNQGKSRYQVGKINIFHTDHYTFELLRQYPIEL